MYCWRVTKYNPQYRNEKGHYLKDEWTFFAQIGKVIGGKKFTLKEYEEVEHKYIQAILLFMNCLNINSLKIVALEKNNNPFLTKSLSIEESEIFKATKNKTLISKEKLIGIIKLILQNKLWCKFESPMMYVHFGWDYYVYIGSAKPCKVAIKKIEKSGLFVEPFESPYQEEE